jgi:hypothetical protein
MAVDDSWIVTAAMFVGPRNASSVPKRNGLESQKST